MRRNTEASRGLNLQQAKAFVANALHEAPGPVRARCIDGRYPPKSQAALAMPGGDAGLLAVGLAAARSIRVDGIQVSDQMVRDAGFLVVGGKEQFSYHTDEYTNENGGASRFDGCGYCRLLSAHASEYLLDPHQVNFFKHTLEEINGSGVQPELLRGSHAERAVMIVTYGNDIGTKNWALDSQTGDVQAFVYEETLAERRFSVLADVLGKVTRVEPARLFEAMKHAATVQLRYTAEALAARLPVYNVKVDAQSGEFSVEGERKFDSKESRKSSGWARWWKW